MKNLVTFLMLSLVVNASFANIIIVDQNGAGQYSSIQAGINAAMPDDTVRVWPGTYMEQITLSKNILVEGSGWENCIITGSYDPTVNISAGIIQWFMISSSGGNGINVGGGGGKVRNCLIKGCSSSGIVASGTGYIENCTIINNGGYGIGATDGYLYVTNCISWANTAAGFGKFYYSYHVNVSYSNGSRENTENNQGCIEEDPMFISNSDYHISMGSPCWNTGNPSLNDPDGSVSDMGYFGGTNCPIYPVVYEIQVTPNGSNINLQAKGRANY